MKPIFTTTWQGNDMSINKKLIEKIREEMIEELINKKGIVDVEKHLLDYLRKFDAVKLVNEYGCSLDEAIDTIELVQKSDEVKKIIMTLA